MYTGLGSKFDIGSGIHTIADLAAGANTGHRIHMRNYEYLGVLLHKGVASAGTDNVVATVQEHTAASGGTSQNLAAIDEFYIKSEATLDGDEVWVQTLQTAAATLTLTGATYAALQVLAYFSVAAAAMSDGFQWLSVNIADPGAGGTIPGGVIYLPHGLKMPRRPDLMPQPNA